MTLYADSPVNKVLVDLAVRSYSIDIGGGILDNAGQTLSSWVESEHVIVITDDVVEKLYLDPLVAKLNGIASRIDTLVVPSGESSKCISQCDQAWQSLVELGTDRKSVVIALGGGVIGDFAGFMAATFARGLTFIQIPTTLLSQVDSSVGGKVGVNLPTAKNMVGAFWQPAKVLIDPAVLSTLDEANYQAGMAEVVKYGLIMDVPLFEFLENSVEAINERNIDTLSKVIAWCCQCKATIVEEDERETIGRRVILNYGHTYGHAIEAVFGYGRFLHGQAISIGMTCAGRLARNLGMVDQAFLDRQSKIFQAFGLPIDCPDERHDELIASMKRDKKVARGRLKLILPTRIGRVESVEAPSDDELRKSLQND